MSDDDEHTLMVTGSAVTECRRVAALLGDPTTRRARVVAEMAILAGLREVEREVKRAADAKRREGGGWAQVNKRKEQP